MNSLNSIIQSEQETLSTNWVLSLENPIFNINYISNFLSKQFLYSSVLLMLTLKSSVQLFIQNNFCHLFPW